MGGSFVPWAVTAHAAICRHLSSIWFARIWCPAVPALRRASPRHQPRSSQLRGRGNRYRRRGPQTTLNSRASMRHRHPMGPVAWTAASHLLLWALLLASPRAWAGPGKHGKNMHGGPDPLLQPINMGGTLARNDFVVAMGTMGRRQALAQVAPCMLARLHA